MLFTPCKISHLFPITLSGHEKAYNKGLSGLPQTPGTGTSQAYTRHWNSLRGLWCTDFLSRRSITTSTAQSSAYGGYRKLTYVRWNTVVLHCSNDTGANINDHILSMYIEPQIRASRYEPLCKSSLDAEDNMSDTNEGFAEHLVTLFSAFHTQRSRGNSEDE